MEEKSQAVETLLEMVVQQQASVDPGDLKGLVTLGELCVALGEAFGASTTNAQLGVYAQAAAVIAERIVLQDIEDGDAALATISKTIQWLGQVLAKGKANLKPSKALQEELHRDTGCEKLDTESFAATASMLSEASQVPTAGVPDNESSEAEDDAKAVEVYRKLGESLDAVALELSAMDPTKTGQLSAVRQNLSSMVEQGGWPTTIREPLSEVLQIVDEIIAGKLSKDDGQLARLGSPIEALQEAIDTAVAEQVSKGGRPDSSETQEPSAGSGAQAAAAKVDARSDAQSLASTASEEIKAALAADSELIGEFVNECLDHVENAEGALLHLESDFEDVESLNAVFRAFHTIKGTCGFLGLTTLQEVAHRAETLLDRARSKNIRLVGGYADLALESIDMLGELVRAVRDCLGGEPFRCPEGLDRLLDILADPEAAGYSSDEGSAEVDLPRVGDLLVAEGKASRVDVELAAAEQGKALIGEAMVRSKAASPRDVVGALRQQKRIAGKDVERSSIKVHVDRLDKLINMVGELVIAHAMIEQDEAMQDSAGGQLSRNISHMGKIVRELQDLSMSLRMVPLRSSFQKMARLVRDLASKSGKKVTFLTDGEDTEIDRNMVEVINDPLVHMVRNSVDHGLESPDERIRAGKDSVGVVTLQAYHAAGNVVIDMIDDGRGLDREKIVNKAVSRKVIESDANMSDSEVYELIFRPGFSTAEQVSEVSGRGVGLDVVRRGVEALRGRIEVTSEKGKGSTFSMRLPLTLAIIDAMVIRVGDQRYIIPTTNIKTSFRPEADMLSTVIGRGEMVMLHGDLMPMFRLHQVFGIGEAVEDPTQALLVVVEAGGRGCALLVDALLGQQQVVVKSVSDGLGKVNGISGGAIMGDGSVGLIIDVPTLVSMARDVSRSSKESQACAAV